MKGADSMAKVSKYQKMVGQVVSMSFSNVKVTGYRKLDKTSKSGRTYKKYEVEIDSVLWVSTTSFKNQSFSKRYFKALDSQPKESVKYELMPVSHLWFRLKTEFNSELEKDIYELEHIDDIKQAKAKWRELSKKYHPDCGWNSIDFNAIHNAYKEHKLDLELIEKIMAEFSSEFGNDEDFEELVDLAKKASKAKARQY